MGSSGSRAWWQARRGAVWGAVAAILFVAPMAAAQGKRAVLLRIKPHVGDTLYTRFEQDVQISGTTHLGAGDTTMTMQSSMLMLSHAVVESSDEDGTTVATVTDSVSLAASGAGAALPPDSVREAMRGKRVELRIAPDGSASVLQAPDEFAPDVRSVISGMPATLPGRPITVGATWEKVMAIPVGGEAGTGPAATLRATYRLDSLSANGDWAYISMRGTLTREPTTLAPARDLRISSSGSIAGTICVDRRHGWWADSHATIALSSILTPISGDTTRKMHVHTRIIQRMRTTDRR